MLSTGSAPGWTHGSRSTPAVRGGQDLLPWNKSAKGMSNNLATNDRRGATAPGLARPQQLAALATGDLARQRTAEIAMLGCLRDHAQLDRITDSGLCHGMAGLFQSAWRMASDAHTPDLAAELPRLTTRLLTQFHSSPEETEFLDGHAGVALALHTAGTDTAPLAHWDACLLLT